MTGSLPDVRAEAIARYMSTSGEIHRSYSPVERRAFIEAYTWHLKSWLPEGSKASWLDLACGQGQLMSLALASGYCDVEGVDLSIEMLGVARANGLKVHAGDCLEYLHSLPSSSYGVVSAFDFVEHLTRPQVLALLREVRRVLQPSGFMLIRVPNGASPCVGDIFYSDLTHESMWTPASISQIASLAGFSSVDIKELGPVPKRLRSFVRFMLWRGVRRWYRLLNLIETGSPGSRVMTRVMLARLA